MKKIYLAGFIVLNIFIWYRVVSALFNTQPEAVAHVSLPAQSAPQKFEKREFVKDPFAGGKFTAQGRSDKKPESLSPDFILTGIVFDGDESEISAVMLESGESVHLKMGSMCGRTAVLEISKDSIIVKTGSRKFRMKENYYEELAD